MVLSPLGIISLRKRDLVAFTLIVPLLLCGCLCVSLPCSAVGWFVTFLAQDPFEKYSRTWFVNVLQYFVEIEDLT